MISRLFLLAAIGFFAIVAHAGGGLNCPHAEATDAHGQPMYFLQHTFADGAHDLVMAPSPSDTAADIKRVTFGGSMDAGCHYAALAIAKGGDWGWHLAWFDMEKQALYYARMDGVAWVSSPPRRLGGQPVADIRMLVIQQHVSLRWQAGGKAYQVDSDDEGRSWNSAQEIKQVIEK